MQIGYGSNEGIVQGMLTGCSDSDILGQAIESLLRTDEKLCEEAYARFCAGELTRDDLEGIYRYLSEWDRATKAILDIDLPRKRGP